MSQFKTEQEVKNIFNGKFRDFIAKMKEDNGIGGRPIPTLRTIGLMSDITFDGIDGEEMDIAWWEMTLATSPEYEKMVDIVHELFYGKPRDKQKKWSPHLSIAYDNPEDSTLSTTKAIEFISRFPSLTKSRKVTAISLWDTNG